MYNYELDFEFWIGFNVVIHLNTFNFQIHVLNLLYTSMLILSTVNNALVWLYDQLKLYTVL